MSLTLKVQPEQLVARHDHKITTTTLIISEAFQKPHKDVLAKIKSLDCSEDFNQRNFSPVEYKAKNGQMQPAYELTKDGFMFLVMGFTGSKAAALKESFINAFNAMAEQLAMKEKEQLALLNEKMAELQKPETLTPEQQRHIQETVSAIFVTKQVHYQTTYNSIKTHFKVGTYKDILKSDYPALCRYLGVEPICDVEAQTKDKLNVDKESIDALLQLIGIQKQSLQTLNELDRDARHYADLAKGAAGMAEAISNQARKISNEVGDLRYRLHDAIVDSSLIAGSIRQLS